MYDYILSSNSTKQFVRIIYVIFKKLNTIALLILHSAVKELHKNKVILYKAHFYIDISIHILSTKDKTKQKNNNNNKR